MDDKSYQANCPDIAKTEVTKKQNYLKNHIITMGYNPEDFAIFIENEKEDGINIENWTLEELETIVELYRKSKNLISMNENGGDSNNLDHNIQDLDDLLISSNPPKKRDACKEAKIGTHNVNLPILGRAVY